nr:hypothetical protein [Propionicimonas sp.]
MTHTPSPDRLPEPVAAPVTVGAVFRTIGHELGGARGAEPAGLVPGRVLGAVGLAGSLVSLLLALLLLVPHAWWGVLGGAVALVGFLLVTLAGYLRFRRTSGEG